jgi:hypothetical protein
LKFSLLAVEAVVEVIMEMPTSQVVAVAVVELFEKI